MTNSPRSHGLTMAVDVMMMMVVIVAGLIRVVVCHQNQACSMEAYVPYITCILCTNQKVGGGLGVLFLLACLLAYEQCTSNANKSNMYSSFGRSIIGRHRDICVHFAHPW